MEKVKPFLVKVAKDRDGKVIPEEIEIHYGSPNEVITVEEFKKFLEQMEYEYLGDDEGIVPDEYRTIELYRKRK